MERQATVHKIAAWLSLVCAIVLMLLPFHALFTTWLGSNFGHLDAWRIWKEVVIVFTIPGAAYIAYKTPQFWYWIRQHWLPKLIILQLLLYVGSGVLALLAGRVNASALIYSLLANLRFLGFFIITLIVSNQSDILRLFWKQIVLIPAAVVIFFGVLQRTILPHDFLKHFGYGPNTIPAYQTVDNKIDYRRIQSTLRGANPLGAYLVVIISAILASTFKKRLVTIVLLIAAIMTLFLTYSRSAYIGTIMAAIVIVFFRVSNQWRKKLVVLGLISIVIVGAGVVIFRHNHIVENTFFHTDNTSKSSVSSNTGRAKALENGLHDVIYEPLGRGPGTAGPESVRNNHPARIAENYYLQIGQEVGWLGVLLFITINILIGLELWRNNKDPLCLMLFASLIGLTIINMLSHAWTDDTLGLLWWGLAGIALSPAILGYRHKQNVQTPKKAKTRN